MIPLLYLSLLSVQSPLHLCLLHEFHISPETSSCQNILFQPIKKPVRTLSIFTSMAFVKDANGISFKNRLKGHIN